MTRCAKNDYLVNGTDAVIQAGTTVIIPVNAIHNDPEFYPDPQKFDPERFDSEVKKNRDPMTWLAFGGGPRNCIGLRFGMMQVRVGLVALIKNFEFSISPSTVIPIGIIKNMRSTAPEDVHLNVKPVN